MYEVECVMKATPHEIKYREENFHDLSSIKEDDIQCTACGEKIIAKTGRCYVNRVVGTLQCQTCYDRYEEKKPWESSNCLNFCIMCGKSSGQIQKCCKKDCTFSSCQACILRNISETYIETNKRKWSCFICSSKLLYPRRAVAATVMASLSEKSCDQPIKKKATNVNVNKTSTLNKKRDRRRPYKKIVTHSSDSDVSSDMSEENVFKKKPATQRPSTSGTALSGFGMKTKTSRVNLTCNNDDTLDKYHNERSGRNNTQLSLNNSQRSTNKRETINNSGQELKARKLNESKRKSTKQLNGNSNINNNNYDIKNSSRSLARQSSNSSSDKEFSRYKIIPSYVPLQRIADIEKDYTTSPANQSSPNDAIPKQDAFIFKNNIHKFLHDMKNSVKILQNHIEDIEKNYHYKENLTADDATHMMVECTSMIRDLKQHVDNSKEKVIHSYDTWCKKAKIKNVLSCKKSPVVTTDTPDCYKKDIEKSVVIDSSNSDSDTTVINFPVNQIKTAMKNTIEKKVAATVGENQHSESSTDISDFDKTEIFSGHEASNPPSPVTTDSMRIDERHNGTREKTKFVGVLEENITKDVENNKKSDSHEKFKRISEKFSPTNKQSNNELLKEVVEDPLMNTQSNDEFLEEVAEDPLMNNQSDDELMMEVAENTLPIPIIDSTNDKPTNISEKSSARSITPQLKLHSNINCHDSSHSSVDMFQDESEHENDDENSLDDIPIKSHAKSLTPQQIPSSKNTTITENNIDEEEERARKAMLLDSSSSDTDIETPLPSKKKTPIVISSDGEVVTDKISSQKIDSASKSSRNSQSERRKESPATTVEKNTAENKEESGDKLPKRRLSKLKRKFIDSSAESLVNENILVASTNMDEERAKNALLDSSSDSDREVVFETSNERNNSLSGDDELSESEDLVNKTNEQENPKSTSLGGPNSNNNNNNNSSNNSNNNDNNNASVLKSKRDKFILCNNTHYKSDPKLRKVLAVGLTRLGKNILEQHSNALKLSREYLENKEVKSLVSIENIEKKKKKTHTSDLSSSSDLEDGETSMKRLAKSKKKTDSEETLLDHLNKATENNGESDSNDGEDDEDRNSDSLNDMSSKEKFENDKDSTERLTSDADKLYKAALLESSNSEAEDDEPRDREKNNMAVDDPEKSDTENVDKTDNNKNDSQENETEKNELDKTGDLSSDGDSISEKNDKGRWKHSKILTVKFSDTDSEEEKRKIEKKKTVKNETSKMSDESDDKDEDCEIITDSSPVKKKRTRRRRLASDSDIKITDDSDNSSTDASDRKKKDKGNKLDNDKKEDGKRSRKRRKKSDNSSDSSSSLEVIKSKPKRKRIRAVADDSDSDSGNELNGSQGRSGRKNIRKVLKDKQVADDTKQAGKLEEERLRRMAERQKLYNEMYEARLANEEKVDKLVLDFDEESKEVLLSVDENLVKRLKPHQARGIKFMWDAAYESLERAKTTSGSGCILAHCMGLGKSFQVVTLSHTLISNSEKTGVNTILIVAPLSTVLNWVNEFKIWLSEVENGDDIEIYEMTKCKTTYERKYQLESWMRTGGILIIGYEMFRNLTNATKKVKKNVRESILKCLIDPGADLVICDEGHLLKNEDSAISKAMRRIRTLRRVVLTGTPLQNNLIEYHCMVQFVKPNLLGTKREFSNRFVNPIQNGQFDDSTEYDVKVMKKRAHVLHKMLEGSVQRFDYSVLMPFLPPKQEYVILARLTEVQVKLYQYYLDKLARQQVRVGSTLFPDFQALQRIWTHPSVVKSHTEKMIEKRRDAETDSEGSLKDFIDDGSDSDSSSVASSNHNSDVVNLDSSGEEKKINKRGTRANPVNEPEPEVETENKGEWWTEFVEPHHLDDMRVSAKLLLLFDIIKESEAIGDKVLVFSQSLYSLTLIEKFLGMIDDETQKGNELDSLDGHTGSWSPGLDYFRFDGQTSADNRSHWVKLFNKPSNTRARLFLISTRAGGLGINLTAANRVVIFDASWNPSHDVQSIFRIYRFGQKKPCYVYRLLAAGTMEEKIYNRQVTKLSLSCRVVDEQQIERHFSNNDLAELYKFDPPSSEPSQLALPKDRLIAEIFLKHKNLVETYHEHDSLLENIAAEELDDEERKQAWLEYEQEKAGNRPMSTQMVSNYQQQQQMLMMQQFNNQMMNMNEMNVQGELQSLLQFISKDYPHLTEAAQRDMAFRTLSNMYSYVENQVTTNLNNPANIPNFNNPTATLANALAQQEYARQHATVNKYQQQQQQQQQQLQYAQKFGNNVGSVVAPAVRTVGATSRDDDIVEIAPSSSRTNSTLPASSSTKSQEE